MKKLMLALLAALSVLAAPAAALADGGTRAEQFGVEFNLNNSATAGPVSRLGHLSIREQVRTLKVYYDFTKVGGATATLALVDSTGRQPYLPRGAIVRDCIIDTLTALTSGGAPTLAIGTGQATNDLKVATAFGSYTGRVACTPVGTAATAIKLTTDVKPSITIASGTVTAGKLAIFIDYVISD